MSRMALTVDGNITLCTASEENIGKGRCNHICHQENDESISSFLERANQSSFSEENFIEDVIDQTKNINNVVNYNRLNFNQDPKWEDRIAKSIDGVFVIGKEGEKEEAKVIKINKTEVTNEVGDDLIQINAIMEFRGQEYDVDLGMIPKVHEDGTITLNGIKNRCLPILSQNKSGLVSYKDGVVIKTSDDKNIVFMINKDNPEEAKMGRDTVPTDEIIKELNGDKSNLTEHQKYFLKDINPIVFERFPNFKNDMKEIVKNLPADQPNDIEYRKVITYEDQIMEHYDAQLKRMGTTFRENLVWNSKNPDKGQRPLFYQKNLTDNIRKSLVGKNNVQIANDLNPIAALSQSHKISLTGEGGFNKDNAPKSLRNVHTSHRDIVDSLDVSLGKNIGLSITVNCDVDERGFLKKREEGDRALIPSDFMPYKKHNDINRAQMFSAHIRQACPIVGGEDPKKVGDKSDKNWDMIKGSKLGCNLNIAYLSMDKNFEDSIVVSESAARKMKTYQNFEYKLPLDNKEIPKEGRRVKKGDFVCGERIKHDGIITKASDKSFIVKEEYPFTVGDKIAGRHGNKGVCGEIRKDKDMPKIEKVDEKGNKTYEPAQIVMSPLAVTGRINLGQIFECNQGDPDKVSTVITPDGKKVKATAGNAFFMRLNHIATKKLNASDNRQGFDGENTGARIGYQEKITLSSDKDRIKILNYLNNQEAKRTQDTVRSLMKAVGVEVKTWNKRS